VFLATLLQQVGVSGLLTWQSYPTLIAIGPLWFVAMLLIFDVLYAAWRVTTRSMNSVRAIGHPFSYRAIICFILSLALASYLIRIIVPILSYVLEFPTLGYLPQYITFFLIGIVAYRSDWLRSAPSSVARSFFVLALFATLTLLPFATSGGNVNFAGNGTWQSAVYALWDSTFAVGMSLGLIILFRHFFNGQGRFGRLISRQSYAAYVIHVPIIVIIAAIALQGIHLETLLKFGLAAIIAVPACFGSAYLVRKIPFVDQIL
jgi:hypothetical protein